MTPCELALNFLGRPEFAAGGIDFCLFDTAHTNPGYIFDFLMAPPDEGRYKERAGRGERQARQKTFFKKNLTLRSELSYIRKEL